MCGIFGYSGERQAEDIVLGGLETLEYRGYDSAGAFFPDIGVVKATGAVAELRQALTAHSAATCGIAHLRWATHGAPTVPNAHPHQDCTARVAVVHNGIIENYRELREELAAEGHAFRSETDTEVIPHLVEKYLTAGNGFEDAALTAIARLRGTYGLLIADAQEAGTIIAARMGAPIAVGIGEHGHFVASDATPLLAHTKNILFLQDGDIAILTADAYRVRTLAERAVARVPETLLWDAERVSKDGYPHFMLKEIFEAPEVITNALRGRITPQGVKLGGLEPVAARLRGARRIILTGCGTAYYAGLLGEYLIESISGIPVEVEYASEFRYRAPIIEPGTVVIAVSQSGETADTLEAIREAKLSGALALGVVNAVGSTIARETDAGVYNHAGPEIGVASTKAFVSQVVVLTLIAYFLSKEGQAAASLAALPGLARRVLEQSAHIKQVAEEYLDARDFLYIGRRFSYPVALEGALKLKEISYIHAEGYGAGEMKHGPLAMIDDEFPTLAIVPQDSVYEKTLSNMIEIRARSGPIIAVATEGDERVAELADHVMYIPRTEEALAPVLSAITLQLFAYYVAAGKGYNVDRPRNLAKSVTVE